MMKIMISHYKTGFAIEQFNFTTVEESFIFCEGDAAETYQIGCGDRLGVYQVNVE